jgi:ubiquinone/menaquinone biosynthesis C-methylase UbiE
MHFFKMKGAWSGLFAFLYNNVISNNVMEMYEAGDALLPEIASGAIVLDVGCGQGHATRLLAVKRPDYKVVGVDLSAAMIGNAVKFGASVPNLKFIRADAMSLPFDAETFDLGMSIASIKHWPDETRGLREIRRVLKPGGKLFILEADKNCEKQAAARFVARWRYLFPGTRPFIAWHFRKFIAGQGIDEESLRGLMSDAGFAHIEVLKMQGEPFIYAIAEKRLER